MNKRSVFSCVFLYLSISLTAHSETLDSVDAFPADFPADCHLTSLQFLPRLNLPLTTSNHELLFQGLMAERIETQYKGKNQQFLIKEELAQYEIDFEDLPKSFQMTLMNLNLSKNAQDRLTWKKIKDVLDSGVNYFEMNSGHQ